MKSLRTAGFAAIAAMSFIANAQSAPLDPNAFASIGTLGGAPIVIDTDALTVDGGAGGVLVTQGGAAYGEQTGGPPDIAVFTFGGGSVLGNVTITGSRAAAILFQGAGQVTGMINVNGASNPTGSGGAVGAVGGADGGNGGPFTEEAGFGPGGGEHGGTSATISGAGPGGGGGGFGTTGGSAGAGVTKANGGAAFGDIVAQLTGGSGGGGGGGYCCPQNSRFGAAGGAGGGALEIGALTTLSLLGANLSADGGDGGALLSGGWGAGGGGSGGGILLHGFDVIIDAASVITANGGDGGIVEAARYGGCGGAGQIAVIANDAGTLTVDGTLEANAGSGVPNDSACTLSYFTQLLTDPAIGEPSTVAMPTPAPVAILALGVLMLARRRHG